MLHTLTLHDFRNYTQKSFEFSKGVNVLVGPNGRGKTNVLEAISLFSMGKSWREHRGEDLIRNEGGEAAESSLLESRIDDDIFRITIQARARKFQKNEKVISRTNLIGQMPTILFAPEHLSLFVASKRERQKFFDRFLSQLFPSYREALAKSVRAMKQKTALFRSVDFEASSNLKSHLHPWNEILSETIPVIWHARSHFLEDIASSLQNELTTLSGSDEAIEIKLDSPEIFEPTVDGVRDFFSQNMNREIAARRNLLGPTRDDFSFFLREKPLTTTASRGEERSVLLALLAAKKQFFENKTGKNPLLLLDDCFSELDDQRQRALEKLSEGTQTFFTTTHKEHFDGFGKFSEFEL